MPKKSTLAKEPILWKDRKRRFGLPLSFTRYTVYEDRLILKIGFFNTVTDETLLYRIMDIQLKRNIGQKIFGVGTVRLHTSDKSHPTMELKNIKKSEDVRRMLSKQIDLQRTARGISGSEFIGGRPHGAEHRQ